MLSTLNPARPAVPSTATATLHVHAASSVTSIEVISDRTNTGTNVWNALIASVLQVSGIPSQTSRTLFLRASEVFIDLLSL